MVANFFNDLNNARVAENLVYSTFGAKTKDYEFTQVGDKPAYYYKGDVIATAKDGREIGIEVKCDSRIGHTRNVLCEYKVFYYDSGTYGKGNMCSDYDIYTIVSYSTREIFVIDFKKLKEIYTKGYHKVIPHADQDTYCYLVPLSMVEASGALITTIGF